MKKRVLFLCTGNSARSQMAEGLLRSIAGDRYDAFSAGTQPKGIHPLTVDVMRAAGMDLSNQASKDLKVFAGQNFDYVITVCDRARQTCPVWPGAVPIHWSLEDPAEAKGDREAQLKIFERVRDEILARLRLFLSANRE